MSSERITHQSFSKIPIVGMGLGAALIAFGALWPDFEVEARAIAAVVGTLFLGWQAWSLWRSRLRLVIDAQQVQVLFPKGSSTMKREAVHAISVRRSVRPLTQETLYLVVCNNQGELLGVPFERHWLHQDRTYAFAQELAKQLGVPLQDPQGERWSQLSFPALRWVGQGREWRLLLVGLTVGGVAMVFYLGLTSTVPVLGSIGALMTAGLVAIAALLLALVPRGP
ncbi:MAG: hypothetical protein EA397_00920 [Deltaproteobacteria bacterium]|nr:MAG: hypothetical protein EA397_00920 [Deltaproteobacteria bacterium]